MTNPFIRADCPDCPKTTGGCGNHGTVFYPPTPIVPSITHPTVLCLHGPNCPLCWYNSTGPKVDIDLGSDL
jgi:hypothetical protein